MQVSTSMHFRVWGAVQQSLLGSLFASDLFPIIHPWLGDSVELSIVVVGPTLFMVATGMAFYFHSPTLGGVLSLTVILLLFCLGLIVGYHGPFSSFELHDSPAWTRSLVILSDKRFGHLEDSIHSRGAWSSADHCGLPLIFLFSFCQACCVLLAPGLHYTWALCSIINLHQISGNEPSTYSRIMALLSTLLTKDRELADRLLYPGRASSRGQILQLLGG
ncbi:hypothetical protein BO82DRAFT_4114 [Aspergillus uvarum CBS 121591]|uniref:Uncharacterized protein n=1 Tax=Aspergillus uvarum CBS 121591 TaxID=1448315 RepID=A0A319DG99_9EURO|nr:hypothetical protein BO82DRAFT_4114 [Aspergillus uvarum CBS 121591]PYH87158.1 hypothetical protein BO82DRAFT_4114 [Aspergillus uvarum CBS 121591]